MLILLSPAKTLDTESTIGRVKHTTPELLADAERLIDTARALSPDDLATLMGISADLAKQTWTWFDDFAPPFTRRNARQAAHTFAGDVYRGLDAASLDGRDLAEAQKTVRILSGLYGVLRPLDLMQPYRLEMGTRLTNPAGKDLYAFWGDRIADLLRRHLNESPGPRLIVNAASVEYAKAARLGDIDVPVVTPVFEDANDAGEYRVVSYFAKHARGLIARHLVTSRARTQRAITEFALGGYRYAPDVSTPDRPTFRRENLK